jgi:cob(I)alamin adenosyltransferase
MSIVTKRGDRGTTDLAGRVPTSKGSLRVESYGTVDELIAQLGLARSLAPGAAIAAEIRAIQRVLFRVCASLATVEGSGVERPELDASLIEGLDARVGELESSDLPKPDWSVAGECPSSAVLDVARTVCRRAERHVVRLADAGEPVDPNVVVYLNRLSDLLWLMARRIEADAGLDASLREPGDPERPWSRAW